jgi:trehalose 6-phosphate synthase/phosphatase
VSWILSVETTPKGIQLFSNSGINEGRIQANSPEDIVQAVAAVKVRFLDSASEMALYDLESFQIHNSNHGHAKTALEMAKEELDRSSKITTSEHGFVDVAVFPMGIDVQSLTRRRKDKGVGEWVTALRERYKGMKMIVARDKLDEVQVCRSSSLDQFD